MTRTYTARCFGNVFVVEKGQTRTLPHRLDLRSHSPTGFAWGYLGSGPAQLALAILCDVYDDETALAHYQRFKEVVICPRDRHAPLSLTLTEVMTAIESIKAEGAAA